MAGRPSKAETDEGEVQPGTPLLLLSQDACRLRFDGDLHLSIGPAALESTAAVS
jgi:hypothetical protein